MYNFFDPPKFEISNFSRSKDMAWANGSRVPYHAHLGDSQAPQKLKHHAANKYTKSEVSSSSSSSCRDI